MAPIEKEHSSQGDEILGKIIQEYLCDLCDQSCTDMDEHISQDHGDTVGTGLTAAEVACLFKPLTGTLDEEVGEGRKAKQKSKEGAKVGETVAKVGVVEKMVAIKAEGRRGVKRRAARQRRVSEFLTKRPRGEDMDLVMERIEFSDSSEGAGS